jgi:hypothetical protein
LVHNVTQGTLSLEGLVDDFTAGNNENGVPQVYFNGEEVPQHGLKKFVQPISNFSVGPGATQQVPVTINIPVGTKAGGYYGLVRFSPTSTPSGGNVNLSASVGTLILLTVPGNFNEDLNIASFDVRSITKGPANVPQVTTGFIFTSPKNLNAVVRFNNLGDIQEQPFGKIELKNSSNKVLGAFEVNRTNPPGDILPSSIRQFAVPLSGIGSFGKYTVEGFFGYGSRGQLLSASSTFYVIPLGLIIVVIIVVFLIIVGITLVPRWIRRYNRKIEQRVLRKAK